VLITLRETGPAVLVPAAWVAAAAAEFGYLSGDGILVAHVVMAAFITFFVVTGWTELGTGALRAWRVVLVVGLGLTLAGLAGFLVDADGTALFLVSLVGWMVLPAGGLVYTGLELPAARGIYVGGAALSLLGAGAFILSLAGQNGSIAALGFALVAIGQTAGILDAVWRG